MFKEVSQKLGLRFIHDSGAKGEYLMPEEAGSGVALFDYDNDGRLDIYLLQCGGTNSTSRNQLWHQEADGKFRNASQESGLDVIGLAMGVATGDFNNDAWIDLVLTEYGRTRLFQNRNGKFEEITDSAGVDNPRWGTAASFIDFDRDGWLDLIVANYVDYNPTEKCYDTAGKREYCGPHSFPSTTARLFHNSGLDSAGHVRFEDVTVKSGITKASGAALGILCADFDGDRWPDIFISDDGRPNRLFINQKNGTFAEEAAVRGVAYTGMGSTAANMGVAVGDLNEDGLFDFFVTHLSNEQHTFWMQQPRGLFQDATAAVGLGALAWKATGFGAAMADFNNDTFLDLIFVNGAVRRADFPGPKLPGLDPFWFPYAQRNQLFLNNQSGKFTDISEANPALCGPAGMGRGLALGDIDNDGAIDFVVLNTAAPAQIFHNVASPRAHWLIARVIDPAAGGRDALGAEVILQAGPRHFWRLVQTSYSYLSASDPRVHFGLGKVTAYEGIKVIWPDGNEEQFDGGPADRQITLAKGAGHRL